MKKFFVVLIVLISACAPEINKVNANYYYNAGLSAEGSKNYSQAREMYYRVLVNARSANAPKEYISAALYNYGRMLGFTCEYTNAIEAIKESLSIEKGISPINNPNITKRLSELGYLNRALNLNSQAAVYFAEAVPLLESLGVSTEDPIGFANYLEIYAEALKSSSQVEKANEISNKSKALISQNPEAKAKFIPVNYQVECTKKF